MPSPEDKAPKDAARIHDEEREARQLALAAVFEAEFGQHTAKQVLQRRFDDDQTVPAVSVLASEIVSAVAANRDRIDAQIEEIAPRYPVVQLAKIDRALLRCAMAELLHSRTAPARVAIAEWVELARTYSGEPARRLLNGVLGRVARDRQTGGSTE